MMEIQPLVGYVPDIGRGLWRLQEARNRLHEKLENLPPDVLDWRGTFSEFNTVGTLLYHIAAIEADWLYAEVLQIAYPPQVVALFPHEVRDGTGRLTEVRGLSLQTHLERLSQTRKLLLDGFSGMTEADYRRLRTLPHYQVTPEWVLHHLALHETEHRGEIQMILMMFAAQA